MSALFPDEARAMRDTARRSETTAERAQTTTLAARWRDLHDGAAELAKVAQLSPEPFVGALATFPDRLGEAPAWRHALAEQGLDDIEAMMRSGLAALETLRQRGAAANAPALALWREFYTARGAVLALAAD